MKSAPEYFSVPGRLAILALVILPGAFCLYLSAPLVASIQSGRFRSISDPVTYAMFPFAWIGGVFGITSALMICLAIGLSSRQLRRFHFFALGAGVASSLYAGIALIPFFFISAVIGVYVIQRVSAGPIRGEH